MKQLNELKVVELASVLAGPLVGSFFAEAGATVIKCEKKPDGDLTRSWKLASENEGDISAYFASANYGKTHLFLDLTETSDRRQLLEELAVADILLSNFKAGDAERFGLSYAFLKEQFPLLIHGQITGFPDDPERTAFDLVLQAEAGYLSMTGSDPGKLAKMPVALIDVLAAHQLKEGLLMALIQKERTGKGALVTVSLYETAIASLANQASSWLMRGHIPQPSGLLHPSIAPYGETLTGSDGKTLVLAVGNDKQFHSLCKVLQAEDLASDLRFAHNPERVKNRALLQEMIHEKAATYTSVFLFDALLKEKVPVGRIRTLDDVFSDEAAQKLVLDLVIGGQTTRRVKGNVFRIRPY